MFLILSLLVDFQLDAPVPVISSDDHVQLFGAKEVKEVWIDIFHLVDVQDALTLRATRRVSIGSTGVILECLMTVPVTASPCWNRS